MGIRTGWRQLVQMRHELTGVLAALNGIRAEMARRNEIEASAAQEDLAAMRQELRLHRRYHEIARHWMLDSVMSEVCELTDRVQMDFETTVDHLVDDRVCFARFGDGELRLMLRPDHNTRFQVGGSALRADLRRVFTLEGYDPKRLLIGFPHPYRKNLHWCSVWMDLWSDLKRLVPDGVPLGNSHVTRPIFFEQLRADGTRLWRRVWDGLRVTVITGAGSRFNLPDGLFDNVAQIDRLDSLPENAYTDLPRLLAETDRLDSELFLIALGPAGTVLAAELSDRGRWALDIGHISNSWQRIFADAPMPERLDTVIPD